MRRDVRPVLATELRRSADYRPRDARRIRCARPSVDSDVQLTDHIATAAGLATLVGLDRRRWLVFVASSTLIDLDHYVGAARKYDVRKPLDGAVYALTGRLPGWRDSDPRYPLDVPRPAHSVPVTVVLILLTVLVPRIRPLALGALWHLALDVLELLWRPSAGQRVLGREGQSRLGIGTLG